MNKIAGLEMMTALKELVLRSSLIQRMENLSSLTGPSLSPFLPPSLPPSLSPAPLPVLLRVRLEGGRKGGREGGREGGQQFKIPSSRFTGLVHLELYDNQITALEVRKGGREGGRMDAFIGF